MCSYHFSAAVHRMVLQIPNFKIFQTFHPIGTCLVKGGLILESISLWLKSRQKGAKLLS